jgi:hypothetical protein
LTKRIVANNPELTPWFPPDVKPVRVGWYHTGLKDLCPIGNSDFEGIDNLWWSGVKWLTRKNGVPLFYQNRYWRGLAAKAVQP